MGGVAAVCAYPMKTTRSETKCGGGLTWEAFAFGGIVARGNEKLCSFKQSFYTELYGRGRSLVQVGLVTVFTGSCYQSMLFTGAEWQLYFWRPAQWEI